VRLGILKADAVLPHLATRFGEYPDMFQRVLSAADPSLTYQTYDVEHGSLPDSLDECDGWLITGSRRSVYEQVPWIERLGELTREIVVQRRKLVAVCFGHQMVAHVLGGTTARAPHGWTVGVQAHRIDVPFPWAGNAGDTIRMIHTHQDQVLTLPPGATRVGGNALVPNGLYRLGDHVMSFQGHPEFDPGYARALYDGRRAVLGEETYAKAVASLAGPTDAAKLADATLAFLRASRAA
jgi:GMP synthase-like glutamine amidotransferase